MGWAPAPSAATGKRALRLFAVALAVGFALLLVPARASAQLGEPPTTPPTEPVTIPPTTEPPATVPPTVPATSTTRRATTSTSPTTTIVRDVITVPTQELDPADADIAPLSGGGGISPIFTLLSIAGFATAGTILFRTWKASTIREQSGHSG